MLDLPSHDALLGFADWFHALRSGVAGRAGEGEKGKPRHLFRVHQGSGR